MVQIDIGGLNRKAPKAPYETISQNWFKSLPYGFSFFSRKADATQPLTIYLPISPSNLVIKTHFATNVITTLYGVVEEHSEVRYYDITISGTTGYAPQFVGIGGNNGNPPPLSGRKSFADEVVFNKTIDGFLPEVTNTLKQVKGLIQDVTGNSPETVSGVASNKSGYHAFHELYKFFLQYKKDTAGVGIEPPKSGLSSVAGALASLAGVKLPKTDKTRKVHPMTFLNYKDGVKYDCIPREFTLTRSSNNPMLYYYNIVLRAYNLRSINDTSEAQQSISNIKSKLGLDSADSGSLFSELSNRANSAATLISAVL